ncbi:glycosyltransferase family 2 protein [Nesterenkonia sp. Act20]|uniref:glycosyltransferase family 2 protein n=1 Tax=Nesterenkonia sp. Act20 TaxID=1483432 RepID=UPI001C497057|nr:glycosyltransferase family 2 protein [Nesterenkonia sp. Act20]
MPEQDRAKITAVIPAHNEVGALPGTIASLRAQTRQPDRILVVSDESTDHTVAIAEAFGVEVMETVDNTARKAGALNQALEIVEPQGFVLVMDADTQIVPDFIERALEELRDPVVGGVGAVFYGDRPTGYLELCQYLEWVRYAEQLERTGKTFVMSGTAALIRWAALKDVESRFGSIYDEATITEDMRLTMTLRECGWQVRSPAECQSTTETMPNVPTLWLQRRRWYLGALQNISEMGWTRVTQRYIVQQFMLALSVVLMSTLVVLTTASYAINGFVWVEPAWLLIGGIFALERVVTVWDQPWRYRIFAALVLPELIYALILQSAYVGAVWQKLNSSQGVWAHLGAPRMTEGGV